MRPKAILAFPMVRTIAVVAALGLARPALAGPPYVSDDPEPTDYEHVEIYTFNGGTAVRGDTGGASGIDFNYGAAPDLQLTVTVPLGFDNPAGSGASFGLSNVELAAKYRFLRQDSFGLDVSVFPRVFLPSPSNGIGNDTASLLLPVWVQKDWSGGWSAFGGGGCVVSERAAQNYCLSGGVVTYQLLPKFQLGVELFHQTADGAGTPAATSLGIGARYDINDNYHLLGYVRRGIQNTDGIDQYSWYASVLFTFWIERADAFPASAWQREPRMSGLTVSQSKAAQFPFTSCNRNAMPKHARAWEDHRGIA